MNAYSVDVQYATRDVMQALKAPDESRADTVNSAGFRNLRFSPVGEDEIVLIEHRSGRKRRRTTTPPYWQSTTDSDGDSGSS